MYSINMVKRLILCADNRSPYEGEKAYWSYMVQLTEKYAKRHTIDFKFIFLKENIEGRHHAWSRIHILKDYINTYDEIMWFDSDATVINQAIDVFDYIKTAKESTQFLKDPQIKPILYTLVNSIPGNTTACSGIFLLDCTSKENALNLLNDWWNDIPDKKYEKTWPWDQSVWDIVWVKDIKKQSRMRVADIYSFAEREKGQAFIHIISAFGKIRNNIALSYYNLITKNKPCKKRIGLFVNHTPAYNGQEYVSLKHSLEATGHIVDLINPDFNTLTEKVANDIWYWYNLPHATDYKDYCLIVLIAIPSDAEAERIKASNVKTVIYTQKTPLTQHSSVFLNDSHSTTMLEESSYHIYTKEIWCAEHSASYLETLNQNKVKCKIIPCLWVPIFLQKDGKTPKYKRGAGTKRNIVILDPTWETLVVCEKLHLTRPDVLDTVYIFNTPEHRKQAMDMIHLLKIYTEKRVRIFKQLPLYDILSYFSNPQNVNNNPVVFLSPSYGYLDITYCGFPIVHTLIVLRTASIGVYCDTSEQLVNSILNSIDTPNLSSTLDTYDPYNNTIENLLPC